ncbi:exonuclease domain-containing protein [Perlabentimonas gracilis]|uniref:exonuclease domain-containing protein n=1 Tax=Perlabentimonas gracilis TaxID=2715279 RepID=UPI00140A2C1E|nr:exonuclease domain-containing protein [Perlabentimonas gracilis]NHB67707.1 GIY-YIG nuclease family protein [Perlabentimonas gracilis]
MFAIVDIETTGGSPVSSRITEIAIFLFDGKKIVDEYTTLINPECYIPPNITRLTGISNEMVANAPRFYEVARRVVEITDGATFVAHNVTFDYKFIQTEFKRLGFDYNRPTLCTVRLSRKHLPGYPSYSLGNICDNLGISINGRHRAAGDALATVKLFQELLQVSPNLATEGQDILSSLAPNLNPKTIADLPEATGVYYLYDADGVIIYIGKSVNIRKRVLDHTARPKTKRATEMLSQISDIGYELTGSELIALLMEADAIKEHLPKYNKRGRRRNSQMGVFQKTDAKGYINLSIETISNDDEIPIASFDNQAEAQAYLYRIVDDYSLCQKLCGLYKSANACFHHQIGQCHGACIGLELPHDYNLRVQQALDSQSLGSRSFIMVDDGRHPDERSFIKVMNGKIEGFGYFNPEYIDNSIDLLKETLTPCGNHREAVMSVRGYMAKAGVKVVDF